MTASPNQQVAILSNAYWASHFGGNHNVVGQNITLNDVPYTVVGVLPAQFYLPSTREGTEQRKPDIWIPYEPPSQRTPLELNRLKMQVYARLRPGISLDQARAEMDVIGKRLEEQNPTLNAGFGINIFPVYVEDVGKDLRRNLLVLLSAVGLILLIACANLANLVLTRAMARQKELAIRKALGASRADLIAQMITESLVLSSMGGILGLLVARWGIKAILALKPADILRPEQIHIGIPVLLFTTVASLLAGVLFGIFPALYVSRTEVITVLKQGGQFTRTHPRTMRAALIVIEVSLASVLLIGAGFMIRSLLSVLGSRSRLQSRPSVDDAFQHAARSLFDQRADSRILPSGAGTHRDAARRQSCELRRWLAPDPDPTHAIHRRRSARSQTRQRADRRHARHQFPILLRNAGHLAG